MRVFYAFDPNRDAVLLVGGNKKGNPRFYKELIPVATKLWKAHIRSLKKKKN